MSYTMNAEQTAVYDSSNDAARDQMWREIRAEVETTGEDYVEIYTADGIVADVIDLR